MCIEAGICYDSEVSAYAGKHVIHFACILNVLSKAHRPLSVQTPQFHRDVGIPGGMHTSQ